MKKYLVSVQIVFSNEHGIASLIPTLCCTSHRSQALAELMDRIGVRMDIASVINGLQQQLRFSARGETGERPLWEERMPLVEPSTDVRFCR